MLTQEQINGYVEDCDKLLTTGAKLSACIDIVKYNLNTPETHADYPLYTEDMAEMFEYLHGVCVDFVSAYEYCKGKRQPLKRAAELPELDLEG